MDRLLLFLGIFAVGAITMAYQSWVYRDKDDKGPEVTGHATVVSQRVDQGRYHGSVRTRWNYMMTFALSDGEEVELYVTDDIFSSLKPGQSGQLTWQGKRFYAFEPDK